MKTFLDCVPCIIRQTLDSVRLAEGCTLLVENVDILNGTPLLDIKPYVPEFDHHCAERVGWLKLAKGEVQDKKADDRFATNSDVNTENQE